MHDGCARRIETPATVASASRNEKSSATGLTGRFTGPTAVRLRAAGNVPAVVRSGSRRLPSSMANVAIDALGCDHSNRSGLWGFVPLALRAAA